MKILLSKMLLSLFLVALGTSLARAELPIVVEESAVGAVTELVFTEGPAWHADGSIYFSDIAGNRIMRLAPGAASADTFLQPSGRANGLMFDAAGQLIVCEGNERGGLGGRRITRIDPVSRQRTVIADRYNGKRFNSPNDLCIDAKGRIYFTDPYYGPDRDQLEMDVEGVYRVDSDGGNPVRILDGAQIARPNGIAISRDQKTLFVVDNHPLKPVRKVYSFALDAGGLVTGLRTEIFDFGKGRGGDGMAIDSRDNIYVTAGANRRYTNQNTDNPAGVYVFSRTGRHLGTIPVPEDMVTNCCFGGKDRRTLFITSGKTVWSIRSKIPGQMIWPASQ